MIKVLKLLLIIMLSFFSTSDAITLQAGISYTIDTARKVAFDDVPLKINIQDYNDKLIDKNHLKNILSIKKNKLRFNDRYLTYFGSAGYSVCYKTSLNIGYYYDNNGNLNLIEIDYKDDYPKKSARYLVNGYLDSLSLTITKNESYIFDSNKKLIAHWIGNNCYNEKGELIRTRQ